MGQGRSKQHRRAKEDQKEHVIYSDYMFFSKEGVEVSKEDHLQRQPVPFRPGPAVEGQCGLCVQGDGKLDKGPQVGQSGHPV